MKYLIKLDVKWTANTQSCWGAVVDSIKVYPECHSHCMLLDVGL